MRDSKRGPSRLPRSVWLLGWVSLATDAATEAIYPLLPFFLTQVLGATAVSLGLIEGAAEAVNSGLKILSGRAADRSSRKRPLVLLGYSVSSLARPLVAVARSWTHVLAVRLGDRVGKGIRTAPRDAMLAALATESTRGRVYGFHRAMDHAGAVLGPILAWGFLLAYPDHYRTLFGLTIVPGTVSVVLLLFLRESNPADDPARVAPTPGLGLAPGPPADGLPRELKQFLVVLTLFTLGNSSDAFLLLRLTDVAGSTTYVPLMWSALHVVKASASIVGGNWSDRVGRRAIIAAGWLIYSAVYLSFAVVDSIGPLFAVFLVYGLYFGFTEGTEKALIADLAPIRARGFAFGVYNAVAGIGAFAASLLFGALWTAFGPAAAFVTGAALSLVATVLILVVVRR